MHSERKDKECGLYKYLLRQSSLWSASKNTWRGDSWL